MTDPGEDRQRIAAFLEMMAAEAGAARNTLLAYERDLRGASELLGGRLADAAPAALKTLAEAWMPLKRATVARKAAALRRFFAFLQDEGMRADDPSPALPRPARERPLPKILDHQAVDALFAEIERRKARGRQRRRCASPLWSNCSTARACARASWSRCRGTRSRPTGRS